MATEIAKRKYISMLFDAETTTRTDFIATEIKAPVLTTYKEKPTCYWPRPLPLKSVHTLTDWKTTNVPFDLYVPLKPIVRTNPHVTQRRFDQAVDKDREQAQKTRPRVLLTPAIGIDDVDDPEKRKIVVNDVYISSSDKALQEALANVDLRTVRAPVRDKPAPTNPIYLRKLEAPYVSPEWLMETVTWDDRQLRADCNATQRFWLKRGKPQCIMCEQSEMVTQRNRMADAMKQY